MTLLHIDKAAYDRMKAQDADGSKEDIEDSVYGWKRMRWYEKHGEGFFVSFCCGDAAIPHGLIPGPDALTVAHRNMYG